MKQPKAERWKVEGKLGVMNHFFRKLQDVIFREGPLVPVEVRRVGKNEPKHLFSLSRRLPHLWECHACGCEVVTIQEAKRHVKKCGRKK